MFERILTTMRNKIHRREYVMSIHADEEMNDDGLSIKDIEKCILTGAIVEKQKDKITAERKYRIRGKSISG